MVVAVTEASAEQARLYKLRFTPKRIVWGRSVRRRRRYSKPSAKSAGVVKTTCDALAALVS
jgi:hypothetical protein